MHCPAGHASRHRYGAGPGGRRVRLHPTTYVFANKRANRIKVLVHDGIGIWLAARRLHRGKFVWPAPGDEQWQLESDQLQALVLGLPWQRMGSAGIITVV